MSRRGHTHPIEPRLQHGGVLPVTSTAAHLLAHVVLLDRLQPRARRAAEQMLPYTITLRWPIIRFKIVRLTILGIRGPLSVVAPQRDRFVRTMERVERFFERFEATWECVRPIGANASREILPQVGATVYILAIPPRV